MKDVVRCDKLGELRTSFDPRISEWGNPPSISVSGHVPLGCRSGQARKRMQECGFVLQIADEGIYDPEYIGV